MALSDVSHHLMLRAIRFAIRGRLRGVWVQGSVPSGALVWATNHHHWWDGHVAAAMLDRTGHDVGVMVDAASFSSFSFLNWIQAVPTDQPIRAVRHLRDGGALIIMPEGRLWGPGAVRPIQSGAIRLARLGRAPLLPVATRVVIRGSQYPEALVSVGEPLEDANDDTLRQAMSALLMDLDRHIERSDPRSSLPGFHCAVRGRESATKTYQPVPQWTP